MSRLRATLLALVLALAAASCASGTENASTTKDESGTTMSIPPSTTSTTLPDPMDMPSLEGFEVPTIPEPVPGVGAGDAGPAYEEPATEGLVINANSFPRAIQKAEPGSTVLLRQGLYEGDLTIPKGVTVKPYDSETVVIEGEVRMRSDSVLAGVNLRSSTGWAVLIEGSGFTHIERAEIRNNSIRGGEIETIRVARNAHEIRITANDLGGGGNHVIKIHGKGSRFDPSASIVGNLIHGPLNEDGIQTEDVGEVLIESNTILGAPENGVDIKDGVMVVVRSNYFDGGTISQAGLIVHADGTGLIEANYFSEASDAELGSRNKGDPSWVFTGNVLDGGGISLRRSAREVVVDGNELTGGFLKLGTTDDGDYPRAAVIRNNSFTGTEMLDRVTPSGGTYECVGNLLVQVTGDWSRCSG